MAKAKYAQPGATIDYVNSGDTTIDANTIVLYGSRLAVVGGDIAPGALGALHVEGVFELPKDYGDSGKALTAGQEVYWDNENSCIKAATAREEAVIGTGGDAGKVTTPAVPASAVHGFAIAAAASAAKTALIKINA